MMRGHDPKYSKAAVSDLSGDETGAPEIEITPAMIEAGLGPLFSFDRECGSPEETVIEIFSRMLSETYRPKRTS
jgi:hypothetical protein